MTHKADILSAPGAFEQVKKALKGMFKRKKRPKSRPITLSVPRSQSPSQLPSQSPSQPQEQQSSRRLTKRQFAVPSDTLALANTEPSPSRRSFVPSPILISTPDVYASSSPRPPSTPVSSIRPELSSSPTTPSRATLDRNLWSATYLPTSTAPEQPLETSASDQSLETIESLPGEPRFEENTLVPSDDGLLDETTAVAPGGQDETSSTHQDFATPPEASEQDVQQANLDGDCAPTATKSSQDASSHDVSSKPKSLQETRHKDDARHVHPSETPDTVSLEPSLEHENDKSAAGTPATSPSTFQSDGPHANEGAVRAPTEFHDEKIPVMAEPPQVRPISIAPGMVATSGPLEDFPFS